MAVNAIPDSDEGSTVQLSATLTDGAYDEVDYSWSVTGGTLDDSTSATPEWTLPAVGAYTDHTATLEITARGTGTNAVDATSDTASDSETATVKNFADLSAQTLAAQASISSPTLLTNQPPAVLDAQVIAAAATIAAPTLGLGDSIHLPGQVAGLASPSHTALTISLSWDAFTGLRYPVSDYEISVDSGAWQSLGSSAPATVVSALPVNTEHDFRIRGVNRIGNGAASATLTVRTDNAAVADQVTLLRVESPGGAFVDASWHAPASDGGSAISAYEVAFGDDAGYSFEETTTATSLRILGLRVGARYSFSVRARNEVGAGASSETVALTVNQKVATERIRGFRIPLINADRQSLVVRLANRDCRIRVYWQPSDASWYADLEVPTNTPSVSGRRLASGAGILDRIPDVLPGNIKCIALDESGGEPERDAWSRQTHALVWVPQA